MNLFKNTRGKIREGFEEIPSKLIVSNFSNQIQIHPIRNDLYTLAIEHFQSASKIVARIRVKLGPKNLNTLGFRGRKER